MCPTLWVGWHPYTSKGMKRGVGALVRDCHGKRFCPAECRKQYGKNRWRADILPSLSTTFCPSIKPNLRAFAFGKNAQGKVRAEGSILKLDKGRGAQASPDRVTSPRSAGRFKGFRAFVRGRKWGHILPSEITSGVWYRSNAHGWPLSAGVNLGMKAKITDSKG